MPTDATLLKALAMVCITAMVLAAAGIAKAIQNTVISPNRNWFVAIGALVIAGAMVFIGYDLFRSIIYIY